MPGPTIAALSIADPLERWAALGFSVATDGCCQIGATELRLGADGDGGIVGWTLTGPAVGDVDRIPTDYRPAPVGTADEHRNTALTVDHVVLASGDVDRTVAALRDAGMTLRREVATGTAERPLRQAFFRHGEVVLEVVGPPAPDPDEPGSRLWGLTITVGDLDACVALLGDRVGSIRDAVQPGRRIATVRREAGLSVPLAVMSP